MTTCSIRGCGKPVRARGLCPAHYTHQVRSGGFTDSKRAANGAHLAWLKEHTNHRDDRCLIWPFPSGQNRYGYMKFFGKGMHPARVMCILVHGRPLVGKETAHSCGNGLIGCVNPRHLRWATKRENVDDMLKHGTTIRGERHWAAKLSEIDVKRIRSLAAQGMERKALARRFKVHPKTIASVVLRHCWAWLEERP